MVSMVGRSSWTGCSPGWSRLRSTSSPSATHRQRSTGLIEAPSCTDLRAFGPGGRCPRQVTTPPRPGSRDGLAYSSFVCSNRACPSTSPTRVARRTTAQGYRSHRWAWAEWLHQPCWSGSCPCRSRSTTSAPCRDVASSDTNVRNTSAERGPWASDDMTGPPNTRRTKCRTHHGVLVMRSSTLLRFDLRATAARGTCAERFTGCDAPATDRFRLPGSSSGAACGRTQSLGLVRLHPGDAGEMRARRRGLCIGIPRPRRRHPHSGRRSRLSRDQPKMEAVRAGIPWHRPVGSTRVAGVSSGCRVECLTSAPSRRASIGAAQSRFDVRAGGTPRSTARLSRDRPGSNVHCMSWSWPRRPAPAEADAGPRRGASAACCA